jgi:hypothetical protein
MSGGGGVHMPLLCCNDPAACCCSVPELRGEDGLPPLLAPSEGLLCRPSGVAPSTDDGVAFFFDSSLLNRPRVGVVCGNAGLAGPGQLWCIVGVCWPAAAHSAEGLSTAPPLPRGADGESGGSEASPPELLRANECLPGQTLPPAPAGPRLRVRSLGSEHGRGLWRNARVDVWVWARSKASSKRDGWVWGKQVKEKEHPCPFVMLRMVAQQPPHPYPLMYASAGTETCQQTKSDGPRSRPVRARRQQVSAWKWAFSCTAWPHLPATQVARHCFSCTDVRIISHGCELGGSAHLVHRLCWRGAAAPLRRSSRVAAH